MTMMITLLGVGHHRENFGECEDEKCLAKHCATSKK